jgi:hypothetical protein
MNQTLQTFVHDFSDENRCILKLDFGGDAPIVESKWKIPPNWPVIENEYIVWRTFCIKEYAAAMTDEQMLKSAQMLTLWIQKNVLHES